MKKLIFVIPIFLAGCVSGPPIETYEGRANDPIVHVQSLVDMRGSIPRHSKTSFQAIYQDEKKECRRMLLKSLHSPQTAEELRASILSKKGIKIPSGRVISITADFMRRDSSGGGSYSDMSCPKVFGTILAESGGEYLFQFSLVGNACRLEAFDVKDAKNWKEIPYSPISSCQ